MQAALHKEEFLASVYACTLELLIFTYESEREFPWVIEVLRLVPVHYYKVIELIIRAEPELSREMVKHLNKVRFIYYKVELFEFRALNGFKSTPRAFLQTKMHYIDNIG